MQQVEAGDDASKCGKKAFVGACVILEVLCVSPGVQSLLYDDPIEEQRKDAPISALEIPYFCPVAVSRFLQNVNSMR